MRLLVSKVALHSTHRNTKNKTKKNNLNKIHLQLLRKNFLKHVQLNHYLAYIYTILQV